MIRNQRLAQMDELIESLPNREKIIMEAIRQGASMRAITEKLHISPATVKQVKQKFILRARHRFMPRRRFYRM
jgi:DNA-binding NarL/FixJ family response regulator